MRIEMIGTSRWAAIALWLLVSVALGDATEELPLDGGRYRVQLRPSEDSLRIKWPLDWINSQSDEIVCEKLDRSAVLLARRRVDSNTKETVLNRIVDKEPVKIDNGEFLRAQREGLSAIDSFRVKLDGQKEWTEVRVVWREIEPEPTKPGMTATDSVPSDTSEPATPDVIEKEQEIEGPQDDGEDSSVARQQLDMSAEDKPDEPGEATLPFVADGPSESLEVRGDGLDRGIQEPERGRVDKQGDKATQPLRLQIEPSEIRFGSWPKDACPEDSAQLKVISETDLSVKVYPVFDASERVQLKYWEKAENRWEPWLKDRVPISRDTPLDVKVRPLVKERGKARIRFQADEADGGIEAEPAELRVFCAGTFEPKLEIKPRRVAATHGRPKVSVSLTGLPEGKRTLLKGVEVEYDNAILRVWSRGSKVERNEMVVVERGGAQLWFEPVGEDSGSTTVSFSGTMVDPWEGSAVRGSCVVEWREMQIGELSGVRQEPESVICRAPLIGRLAAAKFKLIFDWSASVESVWVKADYDSATVEELRIARGGPEGEMQLSPGTWHFVRATGLGGLITLATDITESTDIKLHIRAWRATNEDSVVTLAAMIEPDSIGLLGLAAAGLVLVVAAFLVGRRFISWPRREKPEPVPNWPPGDSFPPHQHPELEQSIDSLKACLVMMEKRLDAQNKKVCQIEDRINLLQVQVGGMRHQFVHLLKGMTDDRPTTDSIIPRSVKIETDLAHVIVEEAIKVEAEQLTVRLRDALHTAERLGLGSVEDETREWIERAKRLEGVTKSLADRKDLSEEVREGMLHTSRSAREVYHSLEQYDRLRRHDPISFELPPDPSGSGIIESVARAILFLAWIHEDADKYLMWLVKKLVTEKAIPTIRIEPMAEWRLEILDILQVDEICPELRQLFNPDETLVVDTRPGVAVGEIVEVEKPGYRWQGRVLLPAKVVVGEG